MQGAKYHWRNVSELEARSYTCGHCGNPLSSNYGYVQGIHTDGSGAPVGHIYLCHHCKLPTFFGTRTQIPGARPGEGVSGIDDIDVEHLYNEIRDSYSQNAFTATVLGCRKLLMHIAVSKGAIAGESFLSYVEFLSTENYIPRDAKGWVDEIREIGNEANHEIVIMTENQAKDLLSFVSMLMKLVYEFPKKVPSRTK